MRKYLTILMLFAFCACVKKATQPYFQTQWIKFNIDSTPSPLVLIIDTLWDGTTINNEGISLKYADTTINRLSTSYPSGDPIQFYNNGAVKEYDTIAATFLCTWAHREGESFSRNGYAVVYTGLWFSVNGSQPPGPFYLDMNKKPLPDSIIVWFHKKRK